MSREKGSDPFNARSVLRQPIGWRHLPGQGLRTHVSLAADVRPLAALVSSELEDALKKALRGAVDDEKG